MNQHFSLGLNFQNSVWDYIPKIDYSLVETSLIHNFIDNQTNGKIHLICNNLIDANDKVGSMENVIELLARNHPEDTFVATHGFTTSLPNIKFTFDIFMMNNDLLEISYLSKFTNVIVGKNNGPYTYTLTRSNLQDTRKNYICITDSESNMLSYGLNSTANLNMITDQSDDIEIAYAINSAIKSSKENIQ